MCVCACAQVSSSPDASQLEACPPGGGGTVNATAALRQQIPGALLQCPADGAALCASLGEGGADAACAGGCVHGDCLASGACRCALEWVGAACDVHVLDVEDFDNVPS